MLITSGIGLLVRWNLNNTSSQPGVCGYCLNPTFTEKFVVLSIIFVSLDGFWGEVVGDCELNFHELPTGTGVRWLVPPPRNFLSRTWISVLIFGISHSIPHSVKQRGDWVKSSHENSWLRAQPPSSSDLLQHRILRGCWGVWAPPAQQSILSALHAVGHPPPCGFTKSQELIEVTRNFCLYDLFQFGEGRVPRALA